MVVNELARDAKESDTKNVGDMEIPGNWKVIRGAKDVIGHASGHV
jgi:hypothetical protein